MNFVSKASALYDATLALVFPQACAVCGASVEARADGVACAACWQKTRIFSVKRFDLLEVRRARTPDELRKRSGRKCVADAATRSISRRRAPAAYMKELCALLCWL